jgi:hypothetical protein
MMSMETLGTEVWLGGWMDGWTDRWIDATRKKLENRTTLAALSRSRSSCASPFSAIACTTVQ